MPSKTIEQIESKLEKLEKEVERIDKEMVEWIKKHPQYLTTTE